MNCSLAHVRKFNAVIFDYETFPLFNVLLTLSKH